MRVDDGETRPPVVVRTRRMAGRSWVNWSPWVLPGAVRHGYGSPPGLVEEAVGDLQEREQVDVLAIVDGAAHRNREAVDRQGVGWYLPPEGQPDDRSRLATDVRYLRVAPVRSPANSSPPNRPTTSSLRTSSRTAPAASSVTQAVDRWAGRSGRASTPDSEALLRAVQRYF